ncbi:monovalent cation:proton antiporter-2 (CPA2) family protein [Novispirillum itersonii]|uniref:CPA2 family monovalent cation:H+ antiporter-2 n=1 Tax=Novispirillum itersonii TaxID=189 RepID=A0A7W9ZCB5_NOVIT|nr:monovalent cation:proton antiporter-2 (CPA2) family protein [Novispirillum itersonii]MBB6208853.1 CPA2 family monovalent cation:H+ antiporter-2 [Novispirillum itersonii]
MPHATPLISTIVAGIVLAFIFGAIAARLRVPPLVGYLIAGIIAGPFTPGFVADQTLAPQLAEIGVILLMFGVGLHFSLKDLLSVARIAIPGAIAQIAVATILGLLLAMALDWSVASGLVFGLALSVASTVVLLRALQDRREIDTRRGRIAVGWLIVEDLAMVLALVLLPALASLTGGDGTVVPHDWLTARLNPGILGALLITLLKVAAFVAVMLIVGRRVIPWLLQAVARLGSRELFRLAVLAIALGVAFGAAKLFGVSLALGAFFAGMVLSESDLSHEAAQESLPLRDAFAVLFFVSVGMLFDPGILLREPLPLLVTLFIILVGKSIAAFLIVRAFGYPIRTALTISASLAQIGEFSFILIELGIGLDLVPERARGLVLAGAIVSILLNPLMFAIADWVLRRVEKPDGSAPADTGTAETPPSPAPVPAQTVAPAIAAAPAGRTAVPGDVDCAPLPSTAGLSADPEAPPQETGLSGHVVLVGHGRVGSLVARSLRDRDSAFLVIEDIDTTVDDLRQDGLEVIAGNAARAEVLRAANLGAARCMVVAIPNAIEAGQVVRQARLLNPDLPIIARAHSDAQVEHLRGLGADTVIMGEREIARGICGHLFPPVPALPAPRVMVAETGPLPDAP